MLRVTSSYTTLARCLGLGLVFGMLALPLSVRAQACEEELAEATTQYNSGRFDAVIETLTPCLDASDASANEKRESFQLLALTYWAKQLEADAETSVRGLLEIVPSYEPGEETPPPFRAFVAEVREKMKGEGSLPADSSGDSAATSGNQSPTVAQPIADVRLNENGDPAVYDLRQIFSDPEGDVLTYSAEIEDPAFAEAVLTGTSLTLRPRTVGLTRCEIEATDSAGNTAMLSFRVNVTPVTAATARSSGTSVDRPKRRWRWLLLGGLVAGGATAAIIALSGGDDSGGGSPIGEPPALPPR